ncbi:MAG TPA: protein kinase, partial [Rubrivivax sp.]|nr:protein kinase [Rubrivivax sp.]
MEAFRQHSDKPSALPAGTRLGEFELLSVLGVGGFGIVYLAFDHALEREVAVKEYMPASLAGRTETMHVSLRSNNDAETFALGLRSFVNEARLLARFDHPSLLKVHRFWEANGTAYMAMPVLRGRTVKEIRLEMVGPPDEAWLRALLDPLLGAMERLHSEGVYHRDIAPDNIQIEPGGRPVLLDFGAARRVLGDKSQSLTAILKPAYAPIEQYAEAGAVKQGPWTDIYALGATLHFLLLTRPPPPATTRAVHDEESLLVPENLPSCSPGFLNVIDWMLAPRPSDRPQSVAALRDVLEGRAPAPVRRQPTPAVAQWERTVLMAPPTRGTAVPDAAGGSRAPAAPRDDEMTMRMPPPTPARGSVHKGALPQPPARETAAATTPLPARSSATGDRTPRERALQVFRRAASALQPATPTARLLAMGLAAAALLIVAFVAVLWPRQRLQPTVVSEPVAGRPLAAAPAPAPAPAPSPAPAPAPSPPPGPVVAESQIATVTVPGGMPPTPQPISGGAGPGQSAPAGALVVGQPVERLPTADTSGQSLPPSGAAVPGANNPVARPLPGQQRPQPANAGVAQTTAG